MLPKHVHCCVRRLVRHHLCALSDVVGLAHERVRSLRHHRHHRSIFCIFTSDHEWAASQPEAAADALLAGADMALGGGCAPSNQPPGCISFGALGNATALGLVTRNDVDVAVARVLRVRFRLGLMDPASLNPSVAPHPCICI